MKNIYNTEQRREIKEFLIMNKENFISADEVLNYMKKHNQEVGQTTIYRFLNFLEDNNEVRTEIKNHTKYYQIIEKDCSNHYHLKCKRCGKTVHLDCKEFEEVNMHIVKKHKFKIDNNTIIYGICNECN